MRLSFEAISIRTFLKHNISFQTDHNNNNIDSINNNFKYKVNQINSYNNNDNNINIDNINSNNSDTIINNIKLSIVKTTTSKSTSTTNTSTSRWSTINLKRKKFKWRQNFASYFIHGINCTKVVFSLRQANVKIHSDGF